MQWNKDKQMSIRWNSVISSKVSPTKTLSGHIKTGQPGTELGSYFHSIPKAESIPTHSYLIKHLFLQVIHSTAVHTSLTNEI